MSISIRKDQWSLPLLCLLAIVYVILQAGDAAAGISKISSVQVTKEQIVVHEYSALTDDQLFELGKKIPNTWWFEDSAVLIFWSFPGNDSPRLETCLQSGSGFASMSLLDFQTQSGTPSFLLKEKGSRIQIDFAAHAGAMVLAMGGMQFDPECIKSQYPFHKGQVGKLLMIETGIKRSNEPHYSEKSNRIPTFNKTETMLFGAPAGSPSIMSLSGGGSFGSDDQSDTNKTGKPSVPPVEPVEIVIILPGMSYGPAGSLVFPDVSIQAFQEPVENLLTASGEYPEPVVLLRVISSGGGLWQVGIPQSDWHLIIARELHRDPQFLQMLAKFWKQHQSQRDQLSGELAQLMEQWRQTADELDDLTEQSVNEALLEQRIYDQELYTYQLDQLLQKLSALMPERVSVVLEEVDRRAGMQRAEIWRRILNKTVTQPTFTIPVGKLMAAAGNTTGTGSASTQTPPVNSRAGGSKGVGSGYSGAPFGGAGNQGYPGGGSLPPSYPGVTTVASVEPGFDLDRYLAEGLDASVGSNYREANRKILHNVMYLSVSNQNFLSWFVSQGYRTFPEELRGMDLSQMPDGRNTLYIRGIMYAIFKVLGLSGLENIDPEQKLANLSYEDLIWRTVKARPANVSIENGDNLAAKINLLLYARGCQDDQFSQLLVLYKNQYSRNRRKLEKFETRYRSASLGSTERFSAIVPIIEDFVNNQWDLSLSRSANTKKVLNEFLRDNQVDVNESVIYVASKESVFGRQREPVAGQRLQTRLPIHSVQPVVAVSPAAPQRNVATSSYRSPPSMHFSAMPTPPVLLPLGRSPQQQPLKRQAEPYYGEPQQTKKSRVDLGSPALRSAYAVIERVREQEQAQKRDVSVDIRSVLKDLSDKELYQFSFAAGVHIVDDTCRPLGREELFKALENIKTEVLLSAAAAMVEENINHGNRVSDLWARQVMVIVTNSISSRVEASVVGGVMPGLAPCAAPLLCLAESFATQNKLSVVSVRCLAQWLNTFSIVPNASQRINELLRDREKTVEASNIHLLVEKGLTGMIAEAVKDNGITEEFYSAFATAAHIPAALRVSDNPLNMKSLILRELALASINWQRLIGLLEMDQFQDIKREVDEFRVQRGAILGLPAVLVASEPDPEPSAPQPHLDFISEDWAERLSSSQYQDSVLGTYLLLPERHGAWLLRKDFVSKAEWLKLQLHNLKDSGEFEIFMEGYQVIPANQLFRDRIQEGDSPGRVAYYLATLLLWADYLKKNNGNVLDLLTFENLRITKDDQIFSLDAPISPFSQRRFTIGEQQRIAGLLITMIEIASEQKSQFSITGSQLNSRCISDYLKNNPAYLLIIKVAEEYYTATSERSCDELVRILEGKVTPVKTRTMTESIESLEELDDDDEFATPPSSPEPK